MPDVGIKILTAFACLMVLIAVPSINAVAPSLLSCLLKWKESVNLHSSVSLSRLRNMAAAAIIPAFLLMCSHFRLIPWLEGYGEWQSLGYTALVFSAYILVRYLCRLLFRGNRMRPSDFFSATDAAYSFFLLMGIVMVLTFCICSVIHRPSESIAEVFKVEIIALYAVFVLRKTQILSHYGGISSGFLYLCTLECLPTGLLTASMLLI
ncbi:MAG: hypothetical protein KBS53_05880 [Bacteroidales bacterium]|nr:hypothetical protein [Candidatus Hennigimonas equi]